MQSLFPQTLPWWEFVLRGAGCYIGLLVLLRLTGKRSFGEMSPFDIVVLILVGGALRSAMVGKDDSFLGPFLAVAGVLALDKVLGTLATRNPAFNRLIEGRAALLAKHGKVIPGALHGEVLVRTTSPHGRCVFAERRLLGCEPHRVPLRRQL